MGDLTAFQCTQFDAAGVDPDDVPGRVREMWLAYVGSSAEARPSTIADVAETFGVPAATVSRRFHEAGLPIQPQGRRRLSVVEIEREEAERAAMIEHARLRRREAISARVERMHALHQAGLGLGEVGRLFGVSAGRVSQLFAWAGLPSRGRGRRPAGDDAGGVVGLVRALQARPTD